MSKAQDDAPKSTQRDDKDSDYASSAPSTPVALATLRENSGSGRTIQTLRMVLRPSKSAEQ